VGQVYALGWWRSLPSEERHQPKSEGKKIKEKSEQGREDKEKK